MRRVLLALAILGSGCFGSGTDGGPMDSPLPSLAVVDAPTDENGNFPVDIVEGRLEVLPGQITRVKRGPSVILLRNGAERVDEDGNQGAVALWIRGRGSRRHFLPQAASTPLFPQTMEDWPIDLEPGAYEISVTLGAANQDVAILLVE